MKIEKPKIVFMGTPEFAVPSLEILLKNDYDISAVITVPDKPQGRGLKLESSDIKKFSLNNNLMILQPEKMKDESFIKTLKDISPDIIVVVAFRILPREIYTIPGFGSFNLHASLLPKYRGAAPINWAVINGEQETGVTTFFLEDKVDTGNIIIQNKIAIGNNDTAGDIHDRLMAIGAQTVLETVKLIKNGNVITTMQDNSLSSPAPKIFKENCKINWNNKKSDIHNLIRGLSPYPCAVTKYKGKIVKIYKSLITEERRNTPPGGILREKDNLFVATADGLLKILEIQMEGKKRLKTEEFLHGFNFTSTDSFEV